jgi:septum formation protein
MTTAFPPDGPEIILASASVSRARLLKNAGLSFTVEPAHVDEGSIKKSLQAKGATALDVAEALAEQKAVKISQARSQVLVIGADQILDLEGRWFDKPADMDHARTHLKTLRGQTHHLATAVVVALGGVRIWHTSDCPALTMRPFSDAFLDHYLSATGDAILSSVGAYHLEGLGAQLFSQIKGDFFSILGLPLIPLLAFLRDRGALPP